MPHMMSEQWFEKKSTLINSAAMGKASSSFEVQETIFAEPKDVENIKKDRSFLIDTHINVMLILLDILMEIY